MNEREILFEIVALSHDHRARLLAYKGLLEDPDSELGSCLALARILNRAQQKYDLRMQMLWGQQQAYERDKK